MASVKTNSLWVGLTSMLLVPTFACSTSAGGPRLAELAISATNESGATTEPVCTRVPVLWGGRAVKTVEFGDVVAQVDANNQRVSVRFSGAASPESVARDIDVDSLIEGYAEQLDVLADSGDTVVISLSSDCPSE